MNNINIFNIYVTRSREERNYFKKIKFVNSTSFVQIVHLDFKYNQVVKNMELNSPSMITLIF